MFDIVIQTKTDSLNIDFRDIKLVANNSKFFHEYDITGPSGESKVIYNLMPKHKYSFRIDGMLIDSLLVEMEDNLQDVKLLFNGLSKSSTRLSMPAFLFKTDSAKFSIIN